MKTLSLTTEQAVAVRDVLGKLGTSALEKLFERKFGDEDIARFQKILEGASDAFCVAVKGEPETFPLPTDLSGPDVSHQNVPSLRKARLSVARGARWRRQLKEISIERRHVEGACWSTWPVAGHTFHGIEQPWRHNLPYHSCFPAGVYSLIPWMSTKHGECFASSGTVTLHEENLALPSITRFACLVHVANYADQVEGCFGLGMTIASRMDGAAAVLDSRAALQRLQRVLGSDPYHIAHIRWAA